MDTTMLNLLPFIIGIVMALSLSAAHFYGKFKDKSYKMRWIDLEIEGESWVRSEAVDHVIEIYTKGGSVSKYAPFKPAYALKLVGGSPSIFKFTSEEMANRECIAILNGNVYARDTSIGYIPVYEIKSIKVVKV